MIILTNCLTDIADEGCLKVANTLAARIKRADPGVTVVSYGKKTDACDVHIPVGKLMFSPKLFAYLRGRGEPVLYIPTYARMLPTAFRLLMLSFFCGNELSVLLTMKSPVGRLARFLLRASDASVIVLSRDAQKHFAGIIGDKVSHLRTGVDAEKFSPVSHAQKMLLRKKYGVPLDKPIVLHVGHMTQGRNVAQLAAVEEDMHVVLVLSTRTQAQQDAEIRRMLEARKNITLIDTYLPEIQEIYQMADVYLFPVVDAFSCIDVPLSALEAAACGLPVVATPYGELSELMDCEGFYWLSVIEPEFMNSLLRRAIREKKSARESVMPYDWEKSTAQLLDEIKNGDRS